MRTKKAQKEEAMNPALRIAEANKQEKDTVPVRHAQLLQTKAFHPVCSQSSGGTQQGSWEQTEVLPLAAVTFRKVS